MPARTNEQKAADHRPIRRTGDGANMPLEAVIDLCPVHMLAEPPSGEAFSSAKTKSIFIAVTASS
jgi:hypothetical protein